MLAIGSRLVGAAVNAAARLGARPQKKKDNMDSYWLVMGLALLPALGNFGGGLLAEFFPTNQRIVSKALHAAAGIVIAVVATELMPEAMEKLSPWWAAAAFGAGGVAYVLISMAVDKLQSQGGGSTGKTAGGSSSGMWMIYIAVSIDLASDGLMIGSGSAVSASMALVLATGQVLADIPEGYATIANMKQNRVPRSRRMLLSASFAIPVVGIGGHCLLPVARPCGSLADGRPGFRGWPPDARCSRGHDQRSS